MSSKYTQRHYEDMAGILRDSRAATSHSELAQLAGEVVTTYVQARMTALFAEDNPRFQPEKFAMAARPSSGPPPALDFGEPEPPAGTYVIRWSVEARDEYEAVFTRAELEECGVQFSPDGTIAGDVDPDEAGLPGLEDSSARVSGVVSARRVVHAAPAGGFTPGEPVEYVNDAGVMVTGTFGGYVLGTPGVYVGDDQNHPVLRLASQVRRPEPGFTPGEPVEYQYGGVGNPAIPYGAWVKGTFGHYVSGTPSVYVLNGLGHRALRLASQVRRPRS